MAGFYRYHRDCFCDGKGRVLNRPAFVDAKNLQPYINQGLEAVLKTIEYTAKNGAIVEGYNAEILPKICELYLDVRAGKARLIHLDKTRLRAYTDN